MPHRPPEPYKDLPVEHNHTPGVVITQVGLLDMEQPKTLQEFRPLAQQSRPIGSRRPSTSQGIAKTPRRRSFSRPLTSEGLDSEARPDVPKVPPKHIQTQNLIADPGKIGVAVGSPTQYSASSPRRPRGDSLPKPPTERMARRLPRSNTDTAITPFNPAWSSEEDPSATQKVKRWRSVGDLFKKKKTTSHAQPSAPVRAQADPREPRLLPTPKSSPAPKPSKPTKAAPRPPTIVEEDEPPNWPARKSSMRPRFRSRSFGRSGGSKSSMQGPSRKQAQVPAFSTAGPWSDFQEQVRKRGSRPQLDVSIPEAEFERYSIMFSELLKKQAPVDKPLPNPSASRHEPIVSVDTIQSAESTLPVKPVSNRDKPIDNIADLDLLKPVPKIDAGPRSPATNSSASGTPKLSYSLFPTVKASPNPSVSSMQQQQLQQPPAITRQAGNDSPGLAPLVPYTTPDSHAATPVVPRDHILSQHASPPPMEQGLGLNVGIGMLPRTAYERRGPSPLARIEPRELRSPDFSPDSPISRGSSVSSDWSDRPSIMHRHRRSKSSGQVIGSPGPSLSSNTGTFYSAEEEDKPPIPVTAHPMKKPNMTRNASLRSHPLHAPGGSPQIEYEEPKTPQVATATQAITRKASKPQMLVRKPSKKAPEIGNKTLARLSESPVRAASPQMVVIDNSDKPDEDEWLKRRSVWGVIEGEGHVGA